MSRQRLRVVITSSFYLIKRRFRATLKLSVTQYIFEGDEIRWRLRLRNSTQLRETPHALRRRRPRGHGRTGCMGRALGFRFQGREHDLSNQENSWGQKRPISPEFYACGRTGGGGARLGAKDRAGCAERIGAECPRDLHVIRLVERRELPGWYRAKRDVCLPWPGDG